MADASAVDDGHAWKFGITFVACGLTFVLGMGVYSVVMYAGEEVQMEMNIKN